MARQTDRRRAEQQGRWAEYLAEALLRLKGYSILARRAKTSVGELDIIARKGRMIVIVEVKLRADLETGLHAVPEASWRRIARGADAWLAQFAPAHYDADRRFDLILVTRNLRLCHLKDTWRPDFALTRD